MVNTLTIQKRDGTQEEFSTKKLAASIQKALQAGQAKKQDPQTAASLADKVQILVVRQLAGLTPRTQDVHDLVIEILHKAALPKVAAAFQKARQERFIAQKYKTIAGVRDDLGLTPHAIHLLAHSYLLRNNEGHVIETPSQLFRRVAKAIAKAEQGGTAKKIEEQFYDALASRAFLPASAVLINAGGSNKMLSNCMLPIEDNLESIFSTMGQMAQLVKAGTVVVVSLDALRPRGALIKGNKGYTTGPISFLRLYDAAADIVVDAARRKVANMAVMRADHPDIEEFVAVGPLRNFKKGIVIPSAFMKAVLEDKDWALIDPSTKKAVRHIKANAFFDTLLASVHTGDPAIIFSDDPIATTPCPSQPLLPYESVPQGVINLSLMVERNHVAWDKLHKTITTAVRFLDDVIDVTVYPSQQVEQTVKARRRLGLGVMGFAEMCIQLGIQYESKKALDLADKVMKFISDESRKESAALAKQRGGYPAAGETKKPMRNAGLTTVTPTGALAMLGPATSGIEPLHQLGTTGRGVIELDPLLERLLREKGAYSPSGAIRIIKGGAQVAEMPRDLRGLFVTSAPTETHLKMQQAFQKHVDNGVGKAVHVPVNAKVVDLRKIVLLAYKMGLPSVWFHRGEPAGPCRGCGV